jgi:hypothetical protein
MKSDDYLSYYASKFRTVEIDSTYYGTPAASTLESWYRKTPADFIKLVLLQISFMYKVPALLVVFLLSLYPCALRAQTTNGSITGRVTDPSKASVPDAKIAAVNTGTNFRYETATKGAGEYTLANLPTGTYRVEVEKSGFKKVVRPDVILHVQDALAIARPSSSCFSGRSGFRTVGGPQPLHVKR